MLAANSAYSQDVQIRYSSLYGKLKNNLKEGHEDVNIRLYLVDQQGNTCKIHKASMRKDKHYEDLVIPADYALSIPLDSNLRQANPDVTFVIDEGITCDVSMQILGLNYKPNSLSKEYIASIVPQMNVMMTDLGGMFSNWFMPKAEGVVVTLSDPNVDQTIVLENGKTISFIEGIGKIKPDDLSANETLRFTQSIEKISPWIPAKS